jgi:hypothetical protein
VNVGFTLTRSLPSSERIGQTRDSFNARHGAR